MTAPSGPAAPRSAPRPDAAAKAAGAFPYAGDLSEPGMLHAATLRCPHATARLLLLDTSAASALPGVADVITFEDLPGALRYGLDVADQPVLVIGLARQHGEPVAVVAAETEALARQALALIEVVWQPLTPVTDPEKVLADPRSWFRHEVVACGDPEAEGEVAVEGDYEIAVQDHAFLAPEAGLAVPDGEGGVDLRVATQWLHSDRGQVAACLGLPLEQVRLTLAGVGGAFGGREDLSLQVHVCLLALRTGRPVRMVYSREDSFLGHVHRHAARLHYRHTANRDGTLVSVRARIVFDGGAYTSSTPAVVGNAVTMGAGPYVVPNVHIECVGVRTNNPTAGAMRGFGVVQTCAAHEAQMDRLAAELGLDPLELRGRNALGTGDRLPTGQVVHGAAPVRELLDRLAAFPLPADDPDALGPGGMGDCHDGARVRRGVGIAVGLKNLAFSEGYDDTSTARVRLELAPDGRPVAVLTCAAAEVGQGFDALAAELVRTELGVEQVVLRPADTDIASAGSTSASRQTWVSGGAVRDAALAAGAALVARTAAAAGLDPADCVLRAGAVVAAEGRLHVPLAEALAAGPVEAERTFAHRPTQPLGPGGQGDAHVSWSFVAHRAVVDVDLDLGTVRLVQLATAQDVGRVLSPLAALGQLEGGAAQGVGLALMEELVLDRGRVVDPSFEGYRLPTTLDLPELLVSMVEEPEPDAPYGAKGIGEAPHVSSPAAVVAALRDATGLALTRLPVRPEHLVVTR